MGLIFGLIKWLIKLSVYLVLFIAIITLIPNLPPYTKFSSIELDPPQPRVGPLKPNGALNNAKRLYENKLIAPEAFALYDGEVYTTLGSGEVVKLSPGGHVTFVTKLGQPCEGIHQEWKCGRPLGLAIDGKGQMYVADAYYGIWRVDIKTDKRQLLVSPRVEIEGRKPMLFNSIAVAKNGDLYWTDSSSDFNLGQGVKSMLSDPSGRLFHYNAATNRSRVLVDGLWFANGVALSPDHQFVVLAESSRYRLLKYYIDGPSKGRTEVFMTGLPGVPDNLQALPDGSGLTVGLYLVFEPDVPFLPLSLSRAPAVRKFAARIMALAEMPFQFLNSQFPNVVLENIASSIGSFKSMSAIMPSSPGLLAVDWNGKILEAYFNTDGTLNHLSDAIVYEDKLLTGSPHAQDFVGSVPAPPLLKKAYAAVKSTPPPKTAETVTKPVPKPTEAPKAKVEEKRQAPKAKVEEKKETPKVEKPAQATPKPTQETPKPTQAPKPTQETPKPSQAPKPTKETPKPTQAPKPTQEPKPTEAPRTTPPPTQKAATTTAKPPTTKPMPKQAETTTAEPPAAKTAPKKEQKTAPPRQPDIIVERVEKPPKKASTDATPIKEEIPSDTVKPTKEKLKVIKKDGPAEIPNPIL